MTRGVPRFGVEAELDLLADDAAQQFLHLADERVEIEHARLEDLLPAEGEELAREVGGLLAGFANEPGLLPRCVVVRARVGDQFRVADDGGEEVVEIVRDAAGEPPDGFHLLRMAQLLLALVQRFLGAGARPFRASVSPLLEEFPHRPRELAELRGDRARDARSVSDPLRVRLAMMWRSGRRTQDTSELMRRRKRTSAKRMSERRSRSLERFNSWMIGGLVAHDELPRGLPSQV